MRFIPSQKRHRIKTRFLLLPKTARNRLGQWETRWLSLETWEETRLCRGAWEPTLWRTP